MKKQWKGPIIPEISNNNLKGFGLLYKLNNENPIEYRFNEKRYNKIHEILEKYNTKEDKYSFDQIKFRENPKRWIKELLNLSVNFMSKSYKTTITANFNNIKGDLAENMKGRMREKDNAIFIILFPNSELLIFHIHIKNTLDQNLRVITRLLDNDNILRWLLFYKKDHNYFVKIYEKITSKSISEWLGIPDEYRIYDFRNAIRLRIHLMDYDIIYELDNNAYEKFINEKKLDINNNRLHINGNYFNVECMHLGSKKLDLRTFNQYFFESKFNVLRIRRLYNDLKKKIIYYRDSLIDTKNALKDQNNNIILNKSHPDISLIMADEEKIFIENAFLQELSYKIINQESLNIHYLNLPFSAQPIKLNNIKIYNHIENNALLLLKKIHEKIKVISDNTMTLLLTLTGLKIIGKCNQKMSKFINCLTNQLSSFFEANATTEFESTNILRLEYKSYRWYQMSNSPRRESDNFYNIIWNYFLRQKTKESENFSDILIIVGIEDDGTIKPIPKVKIKSDELAKIEQEIKNRLSQSYDETFYLIDVNYNKNGDLLILLFHSS